MKKNLSRKLKLNRETLSRLSLGNIQGGGPPTETVCTSTLEAEADNMGALAAKSSG